MIPLLQTENFFFRNFLLLFMGAAFETVNERRKIEQVFFKNVRLCPPSDKFSERPVDISVFTGYHKCQAEEADAAARGSGVRLGKGCVRYCPAWRCREHFRFRGEVSGGANAHDAVMSDFSAEGVSRSGCPEPERAFISAIL